MSVCLPVCHSQSNFSSLHSVTTSPLSFMNISILSFRCIITFHHCPLAQSVGLGCQMSLWGCADSQQYRWKLVKSVRYWWRCIRNLNFGIICKVCHYGLVLLFSSVASWDDSSVNYCGSYLHTFVLQGYEKIKSRKFCLLLKILSCWMWYHVLW